VIPKSWLRAYELHIKCPSWFTRLFHLQWPWTGVVFGIETGACPGHWTFGSPSLKKINVPGLGGMHLIPSLERLPPEIVSLTSIQRVECPKFSRPSYFVVVRARSPIASLRRSGHPPCVATPRVKPLYFDNFSHADTEVNLQHNCNVIAHLSWWMFLPYLVKYRVAHKNVPNFAMMYCSTTEFKQKEITFLKSNQSWTTREIMMLVAFVLTVKLGVRRVRNNQ